MLSARVDLKAVRDSLTAYGIAVHGASLFPPGAASSYKPDDEDALEKKELKMLKRKLPSPKDGWKDDKSMTIRLYSGKNTLYQHLYEIF